MSGDLRASLVDVVRVDLTTDELLLLDGRCREVVQEIIAHAKARRAMVAQHTDLPPRLAAFIADVVREAETQGQLVHQWQRLRACGLCQRQSGYATYDRTTRYHRKGEYNYHRPLSLPGVELAFRPVVVSGYPTVGCCEPCLEAIKPTLLVALSGVRAELPETLTGVPPRFKRYEQRTCTACGWLGHEGEMRRLPALMGGMYAGGCPACPAVNTVFGATVIRSVDGFSVVAVPASPPGRASALAGAQ